MNDDILSANSATVLFTDGVAFDYPLEGRMFIKCKIKPGTATNPRLFIRYTDGSTEGSDGATSSEWVNITKATSQTKRVKSICLNWTEAGTFEIKDFIISTTDSEYTPYNGHVYPISWQDEAGIVYEGYIDLVSGVLTATKRYIIFDGSNDEEWLLFINADSSINQLYLSVSNVATSAGISGGNTLCDKFKSISIDNRGDNYNTCYAGRNGICFNIKDFTVEMWRNWLADNNVAVAYTLETPQTYQLTPTQINTLINQNNAWNNTNGQTEVEYFIPIE